MVMKSVASVFAAGAVALAAAVASGPATAIQCQSSSSSVTRTWNLDPATACGTAGGNVNSDADLEGLGGVFDSPTLKWTNKGDVTANGDNSPYLDVVLTTGTWGQPTATGTWTLSAAFWKDFGEAVIHIHVGGNPQQLPDESAAFYLTKGSLGGTWSYSQLPTTGAGGGLSNLTLWSRGAPQLEQLPVPATAALLGLGLLGMGLMGRRAR